MSEPFLPAGARSPAREVPGRVCGLWTRKRTRPGIPTSQPLSPKAVVVILQRPYPVEESLVLLGSQEIGDVKRPFRRSHVVPPFQEVGQGRG